MKISTKGIYALNILTSIADDSEKMWTVGELATLNNVSVKYLEQIISKLVKNKILNSFRGANGGYMLSREPNKITLRAILEATEGKMKTVSCVSSGVKCDRMSKCKTAPVWAKLDNVLNTFLDSTTLDAIAKGEV